MEREAFGRAWQLLDFKPLAKWSALWAAFLTGLLYIAFLCVLGLFADLIVTRGHIPAYRDLPPFEREEFLQKWSNVAEDNRQSWLLDLGVGEKSAKELARGDVAGLLQSERALVWHAHIYAVLERRVGFLAATLTLPGYRELPQAVQEEFQQYWARPDTDRKEQLRILGDDGADLASSAPDKLNPRQYATIWRAHLYNRVNAVYGDTVANAFWDDRTRGFGGEPIPDILPGRELSDRGILSLVVQSHSHLYGPVTGWLARWNPWMWRWAGASRPNYYVYATGLLAVGAVLAVLRALAMYLQNYLAAVAAIEASNRLRRAVYHHTFRLGRLAFRALGPSEAVGIFTRQLETLHNGMYAGLTVMFRDPIKFALLLVFALTINLGLAAAFLIFALLVWFVGGQVAVYFRRQERGATRQAADQIALLQESLMMMRLVKCFLMELFNQSRVERQLSRYSFAQVRRYRGEAIYRPFLVFLGTLAAAVLLYVAGLIVLTGRLGVASGITLATALLSLYLPLVNWLEHRRLIRKARESAAVVFRFLDRPGEVGQAVGAEFLSPLSRSLEFDDVSLQEPGTGRKLLESVTLTIKAGERVCIVGPEEMQKHALVYLIPRFLDPNSGEIRIDKNNLRWVTLDSLRAQIALVMQHNLVFNDTVANNIGCGDASFDLPKIIEAAKIAHAHHFIQKLPRGYETPIGEMGYALNSSEQFRIALARAVLRDPALLIIEEPVAALDEDTKSLLDDTYSRILPKRTVIFLPHRISTLKTCDRIFVIHKGKVEAAGDHADLLAHHDLYKHLHYLEFNPFAEHV